MGNYRTCYNCKLAKGECARRKEVASSIEGLNVTSIKFRCDARQPLYAPGDRVSVTWLVPQCAEPSYDDWSQESWPATVVSEKGSRFIICVDDVDSDNETPARSYLNNQTLYAKVTAAKLSPLDEPARVVCRRCGLVEGNPGECWNDGTWVAPDCMRRSEERAALSPQEAFAQILEGEDQ